MKARRCNYNVKSTSFARCNLSGNFFRQCHETRKGWTWREDERSTERERLEFRRRLYRYVPGDGVNSHTSTGLRRTEDFPSPMLFRNPTPERTSPHSGHGECIGMRSSKSKTSNSYPLHPTRDVASTGDHPSSPKFFV